MLEESQVNTQRTLNNAMPMDDAVVDTTTGPHDPDAVEVDAILKTRVTLRRSDLPFLRTAFAQVGWHIGPVIDSVTTDDGYDDEVIVELGVAAPLSALATAAMGEDPSDANSPIQAVREAARMVTI